MFKRLVDGLNAKGELVPKGSYFWNKIDVDKDYYLSVYDYNEEQKEKFYTEIEKEKDGKKYKTINGAASIIDVTTDQLVFDFDSENDLEQARLDTIECWKRLVDKGINEDAIQVYFSGKKGFALVVKIDQRITPKQHKALAKNLIGDLSTADFKIFNASRVLRVPFTKHPDTGLYKTPLHVDDLKTAEIDTILEWAKEKGNPQEDMPDYEVAKFPSGLKKLMKEKKEEKKPKYEFDSLESAVCTIDWSKKPKWLSYKKYALAEGYFPPKTRNHALMILGATYKDQGFNKLTTYRMLKGAVELQSKKFNQEKFSNEEIWTNIIEVIYDSQWNGGTYSEASMPKEILDYLEQLNIPKEKEVESNALIKIDDVFKVFDDFARNIEANTIKTGIHELDKKCRITTSMLVGLLGAPASGKTATLLNILNNHSKQGESSVFFSLDMGKPLIYQKMAQRFTGIDSDDLFKIFQEDDKKKQEIREQIKNEFSNVELCFKTGSKVDDMRNYIANFQEKTGRKVRLVCVDYLEKIVGPFSDSTANSGYNAAKLQELANDLELCVIVLLQPQKIAGDPSVPLLSYRRVKGASVIEQDARCIISVYREGYDSQTFENDEFITYGILKNTMGQLGTVDCKWQGSTGRVSTLLDQQSKDKLKRLRKENKEKRELDSL